MHEMPKPTPDHHRLARLAGHWKGKEIMPPSQWLPLGGTAEAETRARVALADFYVLADYEQRMGGKTTFTGHGVYTWDPQTNRVVLQWFDSMGLGREEFHGGWTGDTLTLTSEGPMGTMRMTSDYRTPGRLTTRMEMSADGTTWKVMFDGTYTRVD